MRRHSHSWRPMGGWSGLRKTRSSSVISLTFHRQFERGSLPVPYLLCEKWQMNNWELLWGTDHQIDKRSSSRYLAPRLIHHNEVYILLLKSILWDFQCKNNEVFPFGVSHKNLFAFTFTKLSFFMPRHLFLLFSSWHMLFRACLQDENNMETRLSEHH